MLTFNNLVSEAKLDFVTQDVVPLCGPILSVLLNTVKIPVYLKFSKDVVESVIATYTAFMHPRTITVQDMLMNCCIIYCLTARW